MSDFNLNERSALHATTVLCQLLAFEEPSSQSIVYQLYQDPVDWLKCHWLKNPTVYYSCCQSLALNCVQRAASGQDFSSQLDTQELTPPPEAETQHMSDDGFDPEDCLMLRLAGLPVLRY